MLTKGRLGRNLATAAALFAGLSTQAFAAELPSSGLVQKDTLTYGVAATFAPFEFTKDGTLTGFDIDFINAIAKKLNAKPDAKNMDFKGLIPALSGKRIDIINSAMYINPARSKQVDFIPYMEIGNRVIVAKANPKKITGRNDTLCGTTIAVTLGGIQESQARADDERCKAEGKKGIDVKTLPTAQDSALTLRQGRADAIYDSTPGAVTLMEKVPGVYEAVGPEFERSTQIGIATRKGDTAIQTSIKAAIKEVVADGTYAKLIAKWKLPASVSIFTK